jgi:hypothetical protein
MQPTKARAGLATKAASKTRTTILQRQLICCSSLIGPLSHCCDRNHTKILVRAHTVLLSSHGEPASNEVPHCPHAGSAHIRAGRDICTIPIE